MKNGRSNGEVAAAEPPAVSNSANGSPASSRTSLLDAPLRQAVELERIDAPNEEVEPLLERGILPGCRLRRVRNSPAGDPIISVEGTLLALRRESAAQIFVREI